MEIDHEKICRMCGECCRRKVMWEQQDGTIIPVMLDIYCPCLDPNTKVCRVYHWRHDQLAAIVRGGTRCLRPQEAMQNDIFPSDCPYVPENWTGPLFRFNRDLLTKFQLLRGDYYASVYEQTQNQIKALDKLLAGKETKK